MVFKPVLGLFAGVFGVIVVLIYDVLRRFAIMGKAFLNFIIQYLDEKLPIHTTINPACISRPIPKHIASQIHLQTSLYLLLVSYSAPLLPFSKPFPTI